MADPTNLKKSKEIGRNDILFCLAQIPETNQCVLGSSDFNLYALDVTAEKPEPKIWTGHTSYVTGVACCGPQMISSGYDGKLIWWESASGTKIREVAAHDRWIRGVVSSSDGSTIVSVGDDMVCKIWNAHDGSLKHECRGHESQTPHHFPSMLYACAISADGKRIATGDRVGHVVVWETESGKQLSSLEVPEMYTWDQKARIHSIGGIRSLAFSPDGNQLAVGGMGKVGNIDHLEGKIRVELFDWRTAQRQQLHESSELKGLVEKLVYSADGKWLLAVGGDNGGFVMLLNPQTGESIKQEKAPTHIHDVVLSPDQNTIYAAAHNKILIYTLS